MPLMVLITDCLPFLMLVLLFVFNRRALLAPGHYQQTSGCIFFFFQAEDGIRDADVTGVQTCALPIFASFRNLCSVPSYNIWVRCKGFGTMRGNGMSFKRSHIKSGE